MIIIAGLIVAFILILIFSRPAMRSCRWREDRAGDAGGEKKYKCMACGAEAFTSNGKPPLVCMADKPSR